MSGLLWDCALDVDGLARSSVQSVLTVLRGLLSARGDARHVSAPDGLVAASFASVEHLRVDGRVPRAWAPLSGWAQASDGWVRLHANYPHHAEAIGTALGATTRESLDRVVGALSALAVEERVNAAGGVCAAVRTPEEWAAHPQARATADDPWVVVDEFSDLPEGRARSSGGAGSLTRLPLAGTRVLDLTRVIAGPTCTQLLACLGADVLRIDPPWRPEILDQYLSNGMGKRSASLDLRHARDLRVMREELLPRADVVVLGYRPGALDGFGLDAATIRAERPSCTVVSLSAWGEHGPWGQHPGFDSIVQAASGIASRCADPSTGAPGALPVQALDHATGLRMAAAVLDLLAQRRAATVTASLLGAARALLPTSRRRAGEPSRAAGPAAGPATGTPAAPATGPRSLRVSVESPHGELLAVPPPVLLDGAPLARPVGGYGDGVARW